MKKNQLTTVGTETKDYEEFVQRTREGKNTFDDLLKFHVGHNGFWQYAIMILVAVSSPSTICFGNFITATHAFRCRQSDDLESWFVEKNYSFADISHVLNAEQEGCVAYQIPKESWEWAMGQTTRIKDDLFNRSTCLNGFVFQPDNQYYYEDTIVKEFGLVCDKSYLMPLDTSFYMAGMLVGFLLGGYCADTFGRKYSALFFALVGVASTVILYFSKEFITFLILRLLIGGSGSAISSIMTVIAIEMSTVESRSIFISIWIVTQQFLSRSLLSVEGYFIKDWRIFQLVQYTPGALAIMYAFFLPESARWLYTKGRFAEMKKYLENAKSLNERFFGLPKIENPKVDMTTVIENLEEEYNQMKKARDKIPSESSKGFLLVTKLRGLYNDFFNEKTFRKTLASISVFSLHLCGLYGVNYYLKTIRESIYIMNVIAGTSNLLSALVLSLSYRFFTSRKTPLMIYLTMAWILLVVFSASMMLFQFASDLLFTIVIFFVIILLQAVMNMQYCYIPELYPASLRVQSLGLASGIGRVTVMFVDYINLLDRKVIHGLPLLIFGGIIAVEFLILTFLLPDTTGENLDARTKDDETEF